MSTKPSFFAELKQRHVVRAGIIYAAAVWAIAQGIAQLGPTFGVSTMVTWWFVIACAIGFPFWIAFAWYFRITAHGVEREDEAMESKAAFRRTGRRLDYWIIGILVIAVVLLLTNELILQRGKTVREFAAGPTATSAFDPPADSIVVLPFANLSGEKSQQYFSDGVTEELTGALGQDTGLTVIAWDTAAHYRRSTDTPAEIGKALNVAHILDGSIERAGDEVRVSAELVSTVTGRQLWSAHYDAKLKNIFAVQDEITGAIAGALKVKFAGMQAAPTENPQAHELYLKGLALLYGTTAAEVQTSRDYFQQALKLDPNYAAAWAGLANDDFGLTQSSTLPLSVALPEMRTAAHKALALDPHNVDALADLALADENDHRTAQAKVELKQALRLDPNNASAHLNYGLVLPLKQSLAQTREAVRLDPDNAIARYNLARTYQDLGQWMRELTAAQALIRLSPHGIGGAFMLAFAYRQMRHDQDAMKAFDLVHPETALDKQLVDAGQLTYRAFLQPSLRPKALAALNKLRRAGLSPLLQQHLIPLYVALGEKAAGLEMLPNLCAASPILCSDLAINPMWKPLHGNPRFERLAKQYTTIAPIAVSASASSR